MAGTRYVAPFIFYDFPTTSDLTGYTFDAGDAGKAIARDEQANEYYLVIAAGSGAGVLSKIGSGASTLQGTPVMICDSISLVGATGAIARWASPVAGTILRFKAIIDAALTTGNAVLTGKIGTTAITNGVITCTQAASAAGSVFTATPTAANVLAIGDNLNFTCSGSQDATANARITATILLS